MNTRTESFRERVTSSIMRRVGDPVLSQPYRSARDPLRRNPAQVSMRRE